VFESYLRPKNTANPMDWRCQLNSNGIGTYDPQVSASTPIPSIMHRRGARVACVDCVTFCQFPNNLVFRVPDLAPFGTEPGHFETLLMRQSGLLLHQMMAKVRRGSRV
jgi:hypothetical protein